MDYSAQNIQLWVFVIQIGIIALCILFANILVRRIKFIQNSMLPTAVVAGFILLALRTAGIVKLDMIIMQSIVYHTIALGFIAMSLRVADPREKQTRDMKGAKSGAIIVSTYLVQGIAGLIISITLAWTVMPNFFKAAGLLLPMGFGQGPGQANNIGLTYEAMGFAGGRSFGLAIATAGYLCACIVGVIMLNVLKRQGKFGQRSVDETRRQVGVDFFEGKDEIPVADSIDRFSIQLMLVMGVYLLTYLTTWGLTSGISSINEGLANTVNTLLWGFNFIVGSALAILVRTVFKFLQEKNIMHHQYQNNYLLNRISGVCFDVMIVAGIASIDLEQLTGLWWAFLLLVAAGGVVTWLFLAWICRKIYKGYYYEGLISMYGMLTGTIGSGILLLRQIDPEYDTPAANNLVTGSSFAIIFGIPMLVLVGMAAKSDVMCYVTLTLVVTYLVILLAFILLVGKKEKQI